MLNEKRTTLVLGDRFDPARLEQLLTSRRWSKVARDVFGEGEHQIVEEVWASPGETQAVHYMDDRTMLTRYLHVRGQEIMSIVSVLVGHVSIHPTDELLQDVAQSETVRDLVIALFHLAVGMHDLFDEATLEAFRYFSQHESPAVRRAVVQSLLFANWREGFEILEKMADEDPVPDIRGFASEAATAVSTGGGGP